MEETFHQTEGIFMRKFIFEFNLNNFTGNDTNKKIKYCGYTAPIKVDTQQKRKENDKWYDSYSLMLHKEHKFN